MNMTIRILLGTVAVALLAGCAAAPKGSELAAKRKATRDTIFSIIGGALKGAADYELSKPKYSNPASSSSTYKPSMTYTPPSTYTPPASSTYSAPSASSTYRPSTYTPMTGSTYSAPAATTKSAPAKPVFHGEGYYPSGAMHNGQYVGAGNYYPTNRYVNCLASTRVDANTSGYDYVRVKNRCTETLIVYYTHDAYSNVVFAEVRGGQTREGVVKDRDRVGNFFPCLTNDYYHRQTGYCFRNR